MAGYIGSKAVSVNTTSATITGDASIGGDLSLGDNDKIILGAGSDLQIYHDGNSKITDVGDGKLELHSNGTGVFIQKGATEYMAQFLTDGAVTLYHDNAAKLATKATGVTVTGEMAATTMDLSSNAVIDGSVSIGVAGSTTYALQSKVKAVYFSSTDSTNANITIRKEAATSTDYLQVRDNGNNLISKMTSGGELTVGNGLILTDGNLVVASGHGIDFSATAGSGSSELFSDYEEGTFTPAMTLSTPGNSSFAYLSQSGQYRKVGQTVTFTLELRMNTISYGTGSGSLTINGFPFNFANTGGYGSSLCTIFLSGGAIASGRTPAAQGVSNTANLHLVQMISSAVPIALVVSNYNTIQVSGTYITP